MDSNPATDVVKYEALSPEVRAKMLQSEGSIFLNVAKFEQYQRAANMIARATFIPRDFQNNIGNCMIALNLAERMRADPIMLMQCMYVVHGRPGFEGKFLSALVNNSGRYEGKLKYEWKGEPGKPEWGCRAWAILKGTDERVNGPWVDWDMVVAEGWNIDKKYRDGSGVQKSKWNTMPELMFMYRSASFFCNTHDSDLKMGMATLEELEDMDAIETVRDQGGTYTIGMNEKPAGLYDVNQQAPGQTKPEESNEPNANGNSSSDDDHGTEGPGGTSGGEKAGAAENAPPEQSTAEKEQAQGGQDPQFDQRTQDAINRCQAEDIRKLYKGPIRTDVMVAAKALGIDDKNLVEAHKAIKDKYALPHTSDDSGDNQNQRDQGDPGKDDQTEFLNGLDFFNQATVDSKGIAGGADLFRKAIDAANLKIGQRPITIEQASIFKETYEALIENHKVSAETSMRKDKDPEEPDTKAIAEKFDDFIKEFYPTTQLHMLRNFLGMRSNSAGVPVYHLMTKFLEDPTERDAMIDAFYKWSENRM